MAKSIKELKKENSFLKSKTEKSDITLIELVDEVLVLVFLGWAISYVLLSNNFIVLFVQRQQLKKQLEKTKNQKAKLESLCRSLQAERKQNSTSSNNNSDSVLVRKICCVFCLT